MNEITHLENIGFRLLFKKKNEKKKQKKTEYPDAYFSLCPTRQLMYLHLQKDQFYITRCMM